MLRWIIGNTREDKIQNSKWGNSFKDRDDPYRWKNWGESLEIVDHFQKRVIYALGKKSELIQVNGVKKDKGRPKITLIEVVKKNMLTKEVAESTTSNKIE